MYAIYIHYITMYTITQTALHDQSAFLVLEDVTAPFKRPCILDLKVGSRLHGDDASVGKVRSQTFKCSSTTSRTLGLRLCGMQVGLLSLMNDVSAAHCRGVVLFLIFRSFHRSFCSAIIMYMSDV